MSDGTQAYETAPASYEDIERAGRRGVRFADGSILWADGEKEVPVSGIADETKRAMARHAAEGLALQPSRTGISDAELRQLEEQGRLAASPPSIEERKAAAKEAAGRKPGSSRSPAAPLGPDQAQGEYRRSARVLIEREIERLEELKSLAIAGALEISWRGLPVNHRNPPMALHDAILAAIRVADAGNPVLMTEQLRQLRGWGSGSDARPAVAAAEDDPVASHGSGAVGTGGRTPVPPADPPALKT